MFDLFSHARPLESLGMVDPQAETLELSVSGRDFTIKQSPGILQSSRRNGTTGAAVWTSSVRLAEWLSLSLPGQRAKEDDKKKKDCLDLLLGENFTVLELGSGIGGIVPCVLAPPRVGRFVATDQSYALKLLRQNIAANNNSNNLKSGSGSRQASSSRRNNNNNNIEILSLDWEEDDISNFITSNFSKTHGVDVVLASDTVYNYALISPFVQTCIEICRVRQQVMGSKPTICIVVQRLRLADVFEEWMQTSLRYFRAWRVPDELLVGGLRVEDGFGVHVLVLRESVDGDVVG